MNLDRLLTTLSTGGAKLMFEGRQLKAFARADLLTDDVLSAIRAHSQTLTLLLQDRSSRVPAIIDDAIDKQNAAFPLTDIQTAYLLGQNSEFELGGVPTNYYAEFEVSEFSRERLISVWDSLVAVHPMLRARIVKSGQQQVGQGPTSRTTCEVWDMSGASQEARKAHVDSIRRRLAHPDRSLGMDGRAFSFEYTKLLKNEGLLHVRMDYMLVDFASGVMLLNELSRGLADEEWTPSLPATSFQSVCARRESARESTTFEAAREYWSRRVAGFAAAPELPRSSKEIVRPRFCNRRFELSHLEWEAFQTHAFACGLTPTVALLQAYADILGQWATQTKFALNVTSFGRMDASEKTVIGDFTEVLLLEVDLGAQQGFAARARASQKQLRRDMDNSLYSGVRVLRDLASNSGDATRALMPFVFTSGLGIGTEPGTGRMAFEAPAYSLSQAPQILLDHQIFEHGGGVTVIWDGVDEAFPDAMLDTMFGAYRSLIKDLSAEPEKWNEAWPGWYSGHCEARRAYNNTEDDYQPEPLHLGFMRHAKHAPLRPAIFDGERTVSYGELAAIAAGGCKKLLSAGFDEGNVGIVMNKGWRQIAAVLAVMLAGGTYVPIDINWPKARRDEILDGTSSTFVFVDPEGFLSDLPLHALKIEDRPAAVLDTFPGDSVNCSNPAYIIFTSGSTGKPKGVTVSHASAGNTCDDLVRRYSIRSDDRIFAVSSLNFDLSVFDIFGLLSAGGAIVLPPPNPQPDPAAWGKAAAKGGVTIWNSVPALMQIYANACTRGDAAATRLRLIMLSGDWIPVPLVPVVQDLWPSAEFKSLGGATEAAIWSIEYPITEFDPAWNSVPYGYPLRNQSMHVLDAFMRPCPDHVMGEIYIGGDGLALGYWGDESRTEERFLFHPETGERLYRTGDLGRFTSNGAIEFLGRADNQVKVNGYRIETGEIEHALRSHPAINNALVSVRRDPTGTPSLVAHYTTKAYQDQAGMKSVLERWSDVFEKTYETAGVIPGFDTAGWTDSFSGEAIPEQDMAEWLSETLATIDPLIKGRVLEIGVGTGMLARKVAPRSERFVGIDISETAVKNLKEGISDLVLSGKARIERMSADDIRRIGEAEFDLIIVNSVIQYFPSGEFLNTFLTDIALLLKSNGCIFIGDVRNIDWHNQFLSRLHPDPEPDSQDETIDRLRRRDPELLANPAWFSSLAKNLPVSILCSFALKSGRADTEMNRYRFDAILHRSGLASKKAKHLAPREFLAADWDKALDYARAGEPALVMGFTNAWVSGNASPESKKPGELIAEARAQGCVAQSWLDGASSDSFVIALNSSTAPPYIEGKLAGLAEGPSDRLLSGPSPKDLRDHLAQQLPTYMIPPAFVAIEAFPLTANGKVDLAALPEPDLSSVVRSIEYSAPRGPLETSLAELWREMLGIDRIGRDDDFFRLGGNSLMAAGMLDRAEQILGHRIDLGALLRSPTIANIASRAEVETKANTVVTISGRGAPKLAAIVHPIGGDVFCYASLASIFPKDFEVAGVRSPALDDIEFDAQDVEQLADRYLGDVVQQTGRYPDVIAGWSFGGIVSLEIARKIRAEGRDVKLVAIDALLPDGMVQTLPSESELIASALRDLGGLRAQTLDDVAMKLWATRLAGNPELGEVKAVLAEAGMLAPGMSDNAVSALLRTYKVNARALFRYSPAPVDAPTLVIAASRGEVDRLGIVSWNSFCNNCIAISIDCDHYEIVRETALKLIESHLTSFLNE